MLLRQLHLCLSLAAYSAGFCATMGTRRSRNHMFPGLSAYDGRQPILPDVISRDEL